ncbi:translation initiation factor IF-2 N-terminal domain-containing protein [Staphylococcus chromogenes]|nr:translation initiation factor IF-2 N-terminal domain-containing protein [Staphylococcus chromogenes]
MAKIDRAQLGEKTRVHVLAKQLGISSKELIEELDKLGLVKVAQSNLSREEVTRVLDVVDPEESEKPQRRRAAKKTTKRAAKKATKKADSQAAAPEAEAVEKLDADDVIRRRVEKNVENEIHQIEEKVEKQLAAIDLSAAAAEEQEAELLEDIVPEVTPPPAETFFIAPVFRAPEPVVVAPAEDDEEDSSAKPKRRGRRGKGRGKGQEAAEPQVEQSAEEEHIEEPMGIKGSTRLEAQRRRRSERREESRKKRHIVSEAEFLARRESVERTMVVREKLRADGHGHVTQVGVLEDDLLVEHFVTSETQTSMVGNIYLGRVQNVLPSMEAAFIDIGKGRNGVLYAGEVDWKSAGLGGRSRKIEQALKSGDQVLVQVSKDPVGHKGARLTTQISLAGRFLVYVPGGHSAGISRKLPEPERKRLKEILKDVIPGDGGAIIRTAAEGVHEREINADVKRLHSLWEQIQVRAEQEKSSKGAKPITMYEEPDMLVKVVRDLFNEDFHKLVVDGTRPFNTVHAYVKSVAPDLLDRVEKYDPHAHGGVDAFEEYRIDEQLQKALSRKVWLPSGGTLVIDRTEAMTVIDVNTGKFTGAGGNLEETVTKNNLEAAEEIVRQMRLRDMGGMIVIDFIDMVLPENQDLVLRRLTEALGRDRTRHQVSEVTSLGLVQVTRKKLGTGLLETFATECDCCSGRGIIVHEDPVEQVEDRPVYGKRARAEKPAHDPKQHPLVVAMREEEPEQPAKSIEELADAVIIQEPAPTEERASRRRGRRRTKRAEPEVQADDIQAIAAAAVDVADAQDPEEPSGADHRPAETYEEALEKFNASPRRRRSTRGNSVSDHAPKPEEFAAPEPVEVPVPEPEPQPEPEAPEVEKPRRSRGRRRVVKKLVEEAPVAEPVESPAVPEVAPAPRRGRRRAVKKLAQTRVEQPTPEAVEKPQKPQMSQGTRRRRRVVRRNEG